MGDRMSKLGLKKLLIGVIATILTIISGLTLTVALYQTRKDNVPLAADVTGGIPSDAKSIMEVFPSIDPGNISELKEGSWNYSYEKFYTDCANFYIDSKESLIRFAEVVNGAYVYWYKVVPVFGSPNARSEQVWHHDFSNKTIYLTNDIDLGLSFLKPIGFCVCDGSHYAFDAISPFSGTFDGCYHTISNFKINDNLENMSSYNNIIDDDKTGAPYFSAQFGLFGYAKSATIKNLRIADANIELNKTYPLTDNNTFYDNISVGMLVGKINGCNVSNCVVSNCKIVNSAKSAQGNATGGLIGSCGEEHAEKLPDSNISNCSVECDIDVSGATGKKVPFDDKKIDSIFAAGIVGFSHNNDAFSVGRGNANISRCFAKCNFTYSTYYENDANKPNCYAGGITVRCDNSGMEALSGYVLENDVDNVGPDNLMFNGEHIKYLDCATQNNLEYWGWFKVNGADGSLTTCPQGRRLPSNYDSLLPDERLGFFRNTCHWNNNGGDTYNTFYEVVNHLQNTFSTSGDTGQLRKINWYLPRNNEFHNGTPLPIGFLYNINSNNLTLKTDDSAVIYALGVDLLITGPGKVSINGIGHSTSTEDVIYLPFYRRKSGAWTMSNTYYIQNKTVSKDKKSCSATVYGYSIDANANDGSYYEDMDNTIYDEFKVRFVTQSEVKRRVSTFFGGYLLINGTYDSVANGKNTITGTAVLAKDDDFRFSNFDSHGVVDYNTATIGCLDENGNNANRLNGVPESAGRLYLSNRATSWYSIKANYAYTTQPATKFGETWDGKPKIQNSNGSYSTVSNKQEITAMLGSSNSGQDEFVHLWIILDVLHVDLSFKSTESNSLRRQVFDLIQDGNQLSKNDIYLDDDWGHSFSIGLLDTSVEDAKTGKFKLNTFGYDYYSQKRRETLLITKRYYQVKDEKDIYQPSKSLIDVYGEDFKDVCKNQFGVTLILPKVNPDGGTSEPYFGDFYYNYSMATEPTGVYSVFGISPTAEEESQNIFNIKASVGYDENGVRITTTNVRGVVSLVGEFRPIKYEMRYNLLDDGAIREFRAETYTVETPYYFPTGTNSISSYVNDWVYNNYTVNSWGFLLDVESLTKYGLDYNSLFRYEITSNGNKYYVLCFNYDILNKTNADNVLCIVTKTDGATVQISINNKNYSYAEIQSVYITNGGGGIAQINDGTIDLRSTFNVKSMKDAGASAPLFLALDYKKNSALLKIRNVEYYLDNENTEPLYPWKRNQYETYQGTYRNVLHFDNAGSGYAGMFSLMPQTLQYERTNEKNRMFYYKFTLNISLSNEYLIDFYPLVPSTKDPIPAKGTSLAKLPDFYDVRLYYIENGIRHWIDARTNLIIQGNEVYELGAAIIFRSIQWEAYGYNQVNKDLWRRLTDGVKITHTLSVNNGSEIPKELSKVFYGSTITSGPAEYVDGIIDDVHKFYRIKITPSEIFTKTFLVELGLADYKLEIIYADYYTTAQKVVTTQGYIHFYVISSNGFSLTQDKVGYTNLRTDEIDIPTYSEFNFSLSYNEFASNDILRFMFGVKLENYQIPLYYINRDVNSINYCSTNVGFNVTGGVDIASQKVVGTELSGVWLFSSNRNDLINQGFTHVLSSGNVVSLASLTDQAFTTAFKVSFANNRRITLYKNPFGSDASQFDYYCWTFALGNDFITTANGDLYFYATSLVSGSYGSLDAKTIALNGSVEPYIKSLELKKYNVVVDNLIIDNGTSTSIHDKDESTLSTYFGVGGKGDVSTTGKQTDAYGTGYSLAFTIANSEKYAYPFFNSFMDENEPTVFFTQNDFGNNTSVVSQCNGSSWYLYNYGYQVKGYKIICTLETGATYDLYLSGGKWQLSSHVSSGRETEIASLSSLNLASLAECLDFKFITTTGDIKITMFPTWDAANINPVMQTSRGETSLSASSFKFGANYDLSRYESRYTPEGQSLIFFTTANFSEEESEGIIVNPILVNNILETIAWNYRKIPYSIYTYANGSFKINLTPHYADNIYKISMQLNEVKPLIEDGVNNYALKAGDYSFATKNYALNEYYFYNKELYDGVDFIQYTSAADYRATVSYMWTEDYAKKLNEFNSQYKLAISGNGNTLPILRKVYYTGNNLNTTTVNYQEHEYPSVQGELTSIYIYLANGQPTGTMPAFLNNYYDLILWHNLGSTVLGEAVDYGYKTDLYKDAEHGSDLTANNFVLYDNWQYAQTKDVNGRRDLSLKPHYFRNFYYLSPQTRNTEGVLGEYGYVVIKAVDELDDGDKSINYLAIFLNGKMNYYSFAADTDWSSLLTYTEMSAEPASLQLIKDLTRVDKMQIFAGCDLKINVYDQSKDVSAMQTALYDEMIGYKWNSLTWYGRGEDNIFNSNPNIAYSNYIPKETINEHEIQQAENCNIDVVFEKINYTYAVKLLDTASGSITFIDNNNSPTPGKQQIPSAAIKLGEINTIAYFATLGYEFMDNAFVLQKLSGSKNVLATYESLIDGDKINQSLVINLTGKWLRENFYDDGNYALTNTNMGEVDINTTKIKFELSVKVYDSSVTADSWLTDVLLTDSWTVGTDVALKETLFSKLESNSYGFKYNNKEYAIISTYAYNFKNPADSSNLLDRYDFLLNAIPQTKYNISNTLSQNIGMNAGPIATNRKVYIVMEVSPLLYIDISVVKQEYDTNSTQRQFTIQNQSAQKINALTITLTPSMESGAQYGVEYYKLQGKTRLYTYANLTNTIPSELLVFDPNRYSDVVFKLNAVDIHENGFAITDNAVLQVTFVPTTLKLNVEYQLEGRTEELQNLLDNSILTSFKIYAEEDLHLGSQVRMEFAVGEDYLISISRFGKELYLDNNSVQFDVINDDFDFGAVNIVVNLDKRPNKNIVVRMQLQNNNQQTNSDNLGSFDIIVDGTTFSNTSEVNVVEGKRVDAKIALNTGYVYSGKIRARGVIKDLSINQDTLNLIEAFRVERQGDVEIFPDAGEYVIYVNKIMVNLELVNNANEGLYTISNNSRNCTKTELNSGLSVKIANAYVGSEITFGLVSDEESCEFDHFYYTDKTGNAVPIEGSSLTLTGDLIDRCCQAGDYTIRFGVETRQKYKIELQIEGLESNLRYTTNLQDFENGKYYSFGTSVEFSFYGSVLNKYDVTLNVDGETITKDEFGYTKHNFVLEKDTLIEVSIKQSAFALNVDEYHCNSLADLQNPDLLPVEDGERLNDNLPSSSNYSQQMTLEFKLLTDDYKLTRVEIRIDEDNALLIEIVGGNLSVTFNEQLLSADENGFYNILVGETNHSYQISLNNNLLTISYSTIQDLSISLHYINFKEILPN